MPASIILGTGSYHPEGRLGNEELAEMFETTADWILSRTGIEERTVLKDDQGSTLTLALPAARQALEASGVDASQIDLIVVATVTPDFSMPALATQIHAELGCVNAFAFDVNAACNGFLTGLQIADLYVRGGSSQFVLVIGADAMSRITDYTDRSTSILFADGAGAAVVASSEMVDRTQGRNGKPQGLLDFVMRTDGTAVRDLFVPGGGSACPTGKAKIVMNGRAVFQAAVRGMTTVTQEILERNGFAPADAALVIPHQANQRIIDALAEALGLPASRMMSTVRHTGNTSAGTIPAALDAAVQTGRIARGDLVVLTSVGAGFTWGAGLLRY